jgi:ribonucleotide monophosphatase NagD (HAD superfamily)
MKKVPAIAFDFTGVFASSSKALPNSLQALYLLRKHNLPFVILTNAGGRTDSSRATLMSKLLNIPEDLKDIINESNVIQAHSPMRDIYYNEIKPEWDELVLIGGSGKEVNQVCD